MTIQNPFEQAIQDLLFELGPVAVLIGEDVPSRNHTDYSGSPPSRPLALIRPMDSAGVSTTMRICYKYGVSVVAQGGLTGLCGGARAECNQIALSLERLVGIQEVDNASATMTVLAGTPLETVQQAALDAGFFCPLDLGARGSCSIGGNLATNAGGNRVIRYGMAREMVLGLEVVLADGTLMTSMNKMIKNNAGYDLKHIFIGSEGTLGIITRTVLKMFPKPSSTMTAICAADDFDAVLKLLNSARHNLGPLLSAFEVMWSDYWGFATTQVSTVRNPFEAASPKRFAYVLIEALGTDAEMDAMHFESWLESALEEAVIPDAVVSQSMADSKAFWDIRDATAEFFSILPGHMAFDIGLPVASMDEYKDKCKQELDCRIPGCLSYFYGHIGDGNLHIVVYLPNVDKQPKNDVEDIVYGLARDFKGTISAEHGIGTMKRHWLEHARSREQIELMRTLKCAFDPKNLLNPGKVI